MSKVNDYDYEDDDDDDDDDEQFIYRELVASGA